MKPLLQRSGQKEHFQDFLSSPVLGIYKLESDVLKKLNNKKYAI